ncbi:MAG: radical SAM protein [Myxococcales bacterium]|nr:MAG: radical SAM protein [Myxococcales bacterium]
MRVLVVQPPLFVHREHIDYPAFVSLAAWTVAAHLRAAGIDVELADAFLMDGADFHAGEPYSTLGSPPEKFWAELQRRRFAAAVVHLDPFTVQAPDDGWLGPTFAALRAANPGAPIVLADLHIGGMNYVDYDPSHYVNRPDGADYLLRFEGEASLAAFAQALARGEEPPWPRGAAVVGEALAAPLPAYGGCLYENVDLAAYGRFLARWLERNPRPNVFAVTAGTVPFKASRGCCFACRFCTSRLAEGYGQRAGWRPVETEGLAATVAALGRRPGVDKLFVLDEAANVAAAHFEALLDAAEAASLKLEFPNGLRADRLTEPMIARLAGLISVLSLSPESGAQSVVDRLMGKHQDLAAVERAAAAAKRRALPVVLHFLIGWPGETKRETVETIALARRLWEEYGAEPWVQFVVPMPGTALFETCRAKGLLPDPLPRDYGPAFQGGPLLRDGACELKNADLVRLRDALAAAVRR